jgi:nucleoside-diphosphate-sugar epimerase
MSSQKPLLVVCMATGNQGGSVISHFLSKPDTPYAIRGITRDTSSARSVALASKGVEMVAGDFHDLSSLDSAFKGASVIFGATDYWGYYDDPTHREMAEASGQSLGLLSRENDTQQNKNIMDAAAKVHTLERFVFSSMANVKRLSEGKYAHCYHMDGKALAEEYGRATHPELWEKTSVVYVGMYLENYLGPAGALMRPKLVCSQERPFRVRDLLVFILTRLVELKQGHSSSVPGRAGPVDELPMDLCH